MAPNVPDEFESLMDSLSMINLSDFASLQDPKHGANQFRSITKQKDHDLQSISAESKLCLDYEDVLKSYDIQQPSSEGYWDWPAEESNVKQVEKTLISDSIIRNNASSGETKLEVENYWNWNAKASSNSAETLENLIEYERIRPSFSINHIEQKINVKATDGMTQRSSKNALLSEVSDYWHFPSIGEDDITVSDAHLVVKHNEKIRQLFSVQNIQGRLLVLNSPSFKVCDNEVDECSSYWKWPASNDEPSEALENVIVQTPQHSYPEMSSSSLDKDLIEILKNNDKDQILQWILESFELGLIPSSEVLKQLLDPYLKLDEENMNSSDEDLRIEENYWHDRPEKFSQYGDECYWDEIPSCSHFSNDDSKLIYNDEIPGYWDERVSRVITNVDDCVDSYWNM